MSCDGAVLAEFTGRLAQDGVLQRAKLLHVLLKLFLVCVPAYVADEKSGLVLLIRCFLVRFASFLRGLGLLLFLFRFLITILLSPGVELWFCVILFFLFTFFLPFFEADRERFDELLNFHVRVLLHFL